MWRTLGWTLRTNLYGGWLSTSGNAVRLNRKLLTTSSDSALDGARSRVITYRLMTTAADTSNVARRRTEPSGRFILQVPPHANWTRTWRHRIPCAGSFPSDVRPAVVE